MDRLILLMLAGIIAGFVLVKAPLNYSFLASIEPITSYNWYSSYFSFFSLSHL